MVLKPKEEIISDLFSLIFVATVLTVYGIETSVLSINERSIVEELQQYLPFTVLKLISV